ncbi:MAG: DUF393 domain-containing protein [Pseudomonadota bacterium]
MTAEKTSNANYPLTLFFDGACAVCNLEMDNLKARNTAGLLRFVDISTASFDPAPLGVSLQALNGLLHAQRPDGSLVMGVEVFRLAYGAVGLGHWAAPTDWALVKPWVDQAYAVFARNRYGLSRAAMPLLQWLRRIRASRRAARFEQAAQQAIHAASACHQGQCRIDAERTTP